MGYKESKYEISSHSEKVYNFNKITTFGLYNTIALFYILILVLQNLINKENI